MVEKSDVHAQIRRFLIDHRGQHCERCLAAATGLDPKSAEAAFKPSKRNPYSFMTTRCGRCGVTTLCVAFVGDIDRKGLKRAATGGGLIPH